MTNKLFSFALIALVFSLVFTSCKKEDEINPNDKNSLFVNFENKVGASDLKLGTAYTNGSGEDFTVTTLNYFVSNVSLKKEDGTTVSFPNQYFLIRQSDASTWAPELKDVPAGNYTSITFNVGVDSTKSVSDVSQRTGALDVATNGMYWSWNSGYVFFKFEGTSSVVPVGSSGAKAFQLHVGGYGGIAATSKTVNNNRSVTLALPTNATVRNNIAPELHIYADLAKVFNGTTVLKLATTNSVHSPAAAVPVANNYATMFSVNHVHNDAQ